MKTITLLNEKGGVGKTTMAMTLACGLARDGYRVMLVDSDPQATATLGLGMEHEPGFYDLIQRKQAWANLSRTIEIERIAPEVRPTAQYAFAIAPYDRSNSSVC